MNRSSEGPKEEVTGERVSPPGSCADNRKNQFMGYPTPAIKGQIFPWLKGFTGFSFMSSSPSSLTNQNPDPNAAQDVRQELKAWKAGIGLPDKALKEEALYSNPTRCKPPVFAKKRQENNREKLCHREKKNGQP